MLRFTTQPYVFREARPSALVYKVSTFINHKIALPGKNHRVSSLEFSGGERVRELNEDPDVRLIFVANHSTHSDVEVLIEAQRRCGVWGAFMAAHEVFARHPIQAWVMQKVGAFSVDRERVDRRSIKEGVRIVHDKRFSLGLFPEGNVAFTNERVTSFLDGASFMAVKAQRDLKDTAKVLVIPVSIRFTHVRNVRDLLRQQLRTLIADLAADGVDTHVDEGKPFHSQLEMVGYSVLCRGLKRTGWEPPVGIDSWCENPDPALQKVTEELLGNLESAMGLEAKGSVTERARAVRSQLAKSRLEEGQDEATLRRWDDQSMVILRVQSYSADYLRECPSVDRCSETLEKLREDMADVIVRPVSPRHVHIRFGDAVSPEGKSVTELTRQLQQAVNDGLAAYRSPFVGGEMMEK